jgi:hypothetical protein
MIIQRRLPAITLSRQATLDKIVAARFKARTIIPVFPPFPINRFVSDFQSANTPAKLSCAFTNEAH